MNAIRQYLSGQALCIIGGLFVFGLLAIDVLNTNASVAALPASPSGEALRPGTSSISPLPGCSPLWMVVSSLSPGTNHNNLNQVAAISSNDVWAVGSYSGVNGVVMTLAEHWDGSTWSVVSSPSPSNNYSYLNGVAALASNDVWAVGTYSDPDATALTLVEHWNGTSWSIVNSANVNNAYNSLDAVAARTLDDMWAVGSYTSESGGAQETLTEHWDGSAWSVISSPNVGLSYNDLDSVAAISSSDVWAVGFHNNNEDQTLTEHWDGSTWSVVNSPNVGTSANEFNGVTALASNDVWAVGHNGNNTLTEHWDGSAWSVVPSPNGSSALNSLNGVAAIASNDVWAVGTDFANGNVQTLTEQWTGKLWKIVSSPNVGTTSFNYLRGVAAISPNDVWAVGNISQNHTLTEHYIDAGTCPWAGK